MEFYAHTLQGQGRESWQRLKEHLSNVARMAGVFASSFGGEKFAEAAGLVHDLGKYSLEFQNRLNGSVCAPGGWDKDHSSAGAQALYGQCSYAGCLCAYAVAGHHCGLMDYDSLRKRLTKRLADWKKAEAQKILKDIDLDLLRDMPQSIRLNDDSDKFFAFSLFCRMIYSCLVDADFLDTEAFVMPEQAAMRPKWDSDILERMSRQLDSYLEDMRAAKRLKHPGDRELRICKLRDEVLEDCRKKADQQPGLFTLTVPTGGGKTLSSLAFALRHAARYGKKRVVYVIPYISIIEQTVDVFRRVFETMEHVVLEVHSSIPLESGAGVDEFADDRNTIRLASENFDAPLVVTTAVQFYESLMGNRPSQCRKIHNLADAVIILDEVQTVPADYLNPILSLLKELSTTYHDTVVMCTATQPALRKRRRFPIGLEIPSGNEIVRDPCKLYESMKRVRVENLGKKSDAELLRLFEDERQMLCVVNTRRQAAELFKGMQRQGREGDFHLSTMMCAAHRSEVLKEVKERLAGGLPCRLISTQLIEAGVDVDFPVVFRSCAGLDSIAQAAGRCNRNGALMSGIVYIFESEYVRAEQFQQIQAGVCAVVLDDEEYGNDPLSLEAVRVFFEKYYSVVKDWDTKKLMSDFYDSTDNDRTDFAFEFERAAKDFKLISNDQVSVVVEYDDVSRSLCSELRGRRTRKTAVDYTVLRRLQRYTVQLHRSKFDEHCGKEIELLDGNIPVLISMDYYDDGIGLTFDSEDYTFCSV